MMSIKMCIRDRAWREANRYDDLLESKADFAYNERYGYLTCCPTNVGTGLRASVMLHLPALITVSYTHLDVYKRQV